jgi:ribonuclease Z
MRIRLLGTGTPTPSTKRKSSGYMIEVGDAVILFDQGPGSYHRMLEAGKRPDQVTHLFFSHLHYDHCADYGTLVLTRWDQGVGKIPELKVYGPAPIARMTDLLFGKDGVYESDLTSRTHKAGSLAVYQARGGVLPRLRPKPVVSEISAGDVVEESGWRLKAVDAIHAQPYLNCLAYRLDCPEGSLVYTGDTAPSDAVIDLAERCDVLIHMCHYISGTIKPPFDREAASSIAGHRDAAEVAKKAGARNLVVTHVTESIDLPGVRERVLGEMAEIYKGNIFFGEDLMEIPVGGPKSRKLD